MDEVNLTPKHILLLFKKQKNMSFYWASGSPRESGRTSVAKSEKPLVFSIASAELGVGFGRHGAGGGGGGGSSSIFLRVGRDWLSVLVLRDLGGGGGGLSGLVSRNIPLKQPKAGQIRAKWESPSVPKKWWGPKQKVPYVETHPASGAGFAKLAFVVGKRAGITHSQVPREGGVHLPGTPYGCVFFRPNSRIWPYLPVWPYFFETRICSTCC